MNTPDYFLEKRQVDGVDYQQMRDRIKKQILSFIYDANRDGPLSGTRKEFMNCFPTVYDLLFVLKSFETGKFRKLRQPRKKVQFIEVDEGFSKFVITLQKIESYVMLDVVCKRLYELKPELNYITVHDAIYVPSSQADFVYALMGEEILKATGEIPILDAKRCGDRNCYKRYSGLCDDTVELVTTNSLA